MLRRFKFLPEKNQAEKKNIHGATNRGVDFDLFPSSFHFFAPMDVVEDQDGIIAGFGKKLMKIIHRGFVPMVAVNVAEAKGRKAAEDRR